MPDFPYYGIIWLLVAHFGEWHCLEAILRVKVLLRVDSRVVDATNHPGWAVERPVAYEGAPPSEIGPQ